MQMRGMEGEISDGISYGRERRRAWSSNEAKFFWRTELNDRERTKQACEFLNGSLPDVRTTLCAVSNPSSVFVLGCLAWIGGGLFAVFIDG